MIEISFQEEFHRKRHFREIPLDKVQDSCAYLACVVAEYVGKYSVFHCIVISMVASPAFLSSRERQENEVTPTRPFWTGKAGQPRKLLSKDTVCNRMKNKNKYTLVYLATLWYLSNKEILKDPELEAEKYGNFFPLRNKTFRDFENKLWHSILFTYFQSYSTAFTHTGYRPLTEEAQL